MYLIITRTVMWVWMWLEWVYGLAKFFFFCRAHTGQKQRPTSLPHVKVGACTPTRTTCSMHVASWWNYIYCTFDVVLLHLDKTIHTETCETTQSNIHNNKNNITIMSDQNTSTLQSTYEKVTGAAQSALGSLTGSTADKAQGERKYS